MYRVFSCVVGRGCLLLPVCLFSWQNSVSLWPALFYTPKPNLPVTLGSSWLPTFAFQSPIMKRTSLWVLVLRGHVGLIEPFNFSFFSITGWGIDLDYCDIEWFALGNGFPGNGFPGNGLPWEWFAGKWNLRNGLPQKWTFLRLHPSMAFCTLLLIVMATPLLLRSCPSSRYNGHLS